MNSAPYIFNLGALPIGEYSLIARATDNDENVTDSLTVRVSVVAESVNQPPTALFSYTVSGLMLNLDASDAFDIDGTITAYHWDFGDGNTGTGETVSHTYAVAGEYTVSLSVTDDDMASAFIVESISTHTVDAITCSLGSADIWNNGFVLNNIAVTNTSASPISDWVVVIPVNTDVQINQTWNADAVVSNNEIIVSAIQTLMPAQSISIGMLGAHTGDFVAPTTCFELPRPE